MLTFENFKDNHIEAAARLALAEYFEEQNTVPILPSGDYHKFFCQMISEMVEHHLGIVAIETGKLVGFFTCHNPINNHFGTTMAAFSPIHAHGAIKNNRNRIDSQMYPQAAQKWVNNGILSHAIALYAHDAEALNCFFGNGFGLRCVDAIREVTPVICGEFSDYTFDELPVGEIAQIVPLKDLLNQHLQNAPMFVPSFFSRDAAEIKAENERRRSGYFVVRDKGKRLLLSR